MNVRYFHLIYAKETLSICNEGMKLNESPPDMSTTCEYNILFIFGYSHTA